jgi:hypothetical protein
MHAKSTIVTRMRPVRVPTLGQMNKCLAAVITVLSYTLAHECKRLLPESEKLHKSFSVSKGLAHVYAGLIEEYHLEAACGLATSGGGAMPQVFFALPHPPKRLERLKTG